jgi:hypothetical protein
MTRQEERFKWQTMSGETTTRGDLAVTPQSRALTIRWPNGGWVWNRPAAVLVDRDGEQRRIPIVDVTRIVQLMLYGLSLVFVLSGLYMMIQKRRE